MSAATTACKRERERHVMAPCPSSPTGSSEALAECRPPVGVQGPRRRKIGAGNGIRTRDFDLGKVALYH
jgi:hypothetical protein